MASFIATDPSYIEECKEWTQCVAKNEEDIAVLRKQIGDLKEILLVGNSELIRAKIALKDINKSILYAKGRVEVVRDLMEVYGKWTSCIVGEVADPNDSEEFVHKFALCNTGFPSCDIVMASCSCYYHLWYIVIQTWHSKTCLNESSVREFIEEWRRSMGLFYFEGNYSKEKLGTVVLGLQNPSTLQVVVSNHLASTASST